MVLWSVGCSFKTPSVLPVGTVDYSRFSVSRLQKLEQPANRPFPLVVTPSSPDVIEKLKCVLVKSGGVNT